MSEKQKKLFAVKTKKSIRFPGLEYPASVDPAKLDIFFMPTRIRKEIASINKFAKTAGVNLCEEVGITPHNFVQLCVWINFRYENNGLAADHWGHTPRIETATRAINAKFGTCMTPFHYFELQIAMRKHTVKSRRGSAGTLATYSFKSGKYRTAAV